MKDHKRKHTGKADNVKKALYTWFVDAQAWDVPITTLVLEKKAKQFAIALDKPDFKVSKEWLRQWNTRKGIRHMYKKAHGEKNDADLLKCGLLLCFLRYWRNFNHKTSTVQMKWEFTTELFLMVPWH